MSIPEKKIVKIELASIEEYRAPEGWEIENFNIGTHYAFVLIKKVSDN